MSNDATTDVHVRKDGTIKLPIAYLVSFIGAVIGGTVFCTTFYFMILDMKRTQEDNHKLLDMKVNHLFQKLQVDNPWTSTTYGGIRRATLPD